MSVAAANGEAAFSETVLSLPSAGVAQVMSARTLPERPVNTPISRFLGPLFEKAPVLEKKVNVGGQPVPVWALSAVGLVLAAFGVFLVFGLLLAHGVSSSDDVKGSGSGSASVGASSAPPPESVKALAARAATGDRDAIARLQARPEQERGAAEWRALGRGHALIGHVAPSLQAYKKALALDPGLAKDQALVSDVHKAALASATTADALDLALAHLGSAGADLVYDVWSRTRSSKDDQDVARLAKQRLDSAAIRTKASPALIVTLDLAKGKTCGDFKSLLPRVEQSGDARAVPKLRALGARRGCGFFSLGDCYPCLRSGTALEDATKAADSRPTPSF